MRILIACEFSGIVRDEFRKRGHEAWSCDLLDCEQGEESGLHHTGDVREVIAHGFGAPWDMMIAHPPCTYITRAGWHWVNKPDSAVHPLKGQPRRKAAEEAADFFRFLLNADIPRICIENPRPICHVNLPAPSQTIQPWQYWTGEPGKGETKATCLWLKGLPNLVPTTPHETGRVARVHMASPSPMRWKERSRTPQGIAQAMAEQWG